MKRVQDNFSSSNFLVNTRQYIHIRKETTVRRKYLLAGNPAKSPTPLLVGCSTADGNSHFVSNQDNFHNSYILHASRQQTPVAGEATTERVRG